MYKIIIGVLLSLCFPLMMISSILLHVKNMDDELMFSVMLPFVFGGLALLLWMLLEHFFIEGVAHRSIWWGVLLSTGFLGATVYFFCIIVPRELQRRRCNISQ